MAVCAADRGARARLLPELSVRIAAGQVVSSVEKPSMVVVVVAGQRVSSLQGAHQFFAARRPRCRRYSRTIDSREPCTRPGRYTRAHANASLGTRVYRRLTGATVTSVVFPRTPFERSASDLATPKVVVPLFFPPRFVFSFSLLVNVQKNVPLE